MPQAIGFGAADAAIRVYVKNRPPLVEFQQLHTLLPLDKEAIEKINAEAGNGWRKVFNVYAKWLFALHGEQGGLGEFQSWQQLRDQLLLRQHSNTALLFSTPELKSPALHVIAGRTYAQELAAQPSLGINLIWLDKEFAVDQANRVLVCPYFDYRQLSNVKIDKLCQLIRELVPGYI
ncbi:DUF6942 family protein [Pseudoalteromonas sp. T1lg88]|uniref:DUF6942 family protein n=1 Tax=Pseudoalteromonas sp. T1lg88 TaxID=2077104 RepID=UPI000CF6C6BB|nr:hypothetical protein [Pseudoalteromonas sp. T1lg88]